MKITPEAQEMLKDVLEENEDGFIRLGRLTIGAGCSLKIKLGVTVDDSFDEDNDVSLEVDGLPIVVEKSLKDSLEGATISINEEGITVSVPCCVE